MFLMSRTFCTTSRLPNRSSHSHSCIGGTDLKKQRYSSIFLIFLLVFGLLTPYSTVAAESDAADSGSDTEKVEVDGSDKANNDQNEKSIDAKAEIDESNEKTKEVIKKQDEKQLEKKNEDTEKVVEKKKESKQADDAAEKEQTNDESKQDQSKVDEHKQ